MSAIRREVQIGDCRLILGDCLEVLPLFGRNVEGPSSFLDRPLTDKSCLPGCVARASALADAAIIAESNAEGNCSELFPALGRVDAVVTDPPYGNKHSGDSSRFSGGNTRRGKGSTHGAIVGDGKAFDPTPFLIGDHQIFFGSNYFSNRLEPGSLLIWAKRRPAAYGSFLSDGEVAWFSKGRGIYMMEHIFAGSAPALEWTDNAYATSAHPFQKPVAVMEWCLGFVPDAKVIFDPFMGSGTTGVACVKQNRSFIGVEIEEAYFERACERIRKAYAQPDLFIEPRAPEPVQEALL